MGYTWDIAWHTGAGVCLYACKYCTCTCMWQEDVHTCSTCSTCSYLCGTAQRLRQPAAGFEELDEVIDDQLSLLVIPHHGHKNLRRRMVTAGTKTDLKIKLDLRKTGGRPLQIINLMSEQLEQCIFYDWDKHKPKRGATRYYRPHGKQLLPSVTSVSGSGLAWKTVYI